MPLAFWCIGSIRLDVTSHQWFSVLVPFLEQGGLWMRCKNANFQRVSVPKTFCISAAFLSRDFAKFKIFFSLIFLRYCYFRYRLVLLKGSCLLNEYSSHFSPLSLPCHLLWLTQRDFTLGLRYWIHLYNVQGKGCEVQISWITCKPETKFKGTFFFFFFFN